MPPAHHIVGDKKERRPSGSPDLRAPQVMAVTCYNSFFGALWFLVSLSFLVLLHSPCAHAGTHSRSCLQYVWSSCSLAQSWHLYWRLELPAPPQLAHLAVCSGWTLHLLTHTHTLAGVGSGLEAGATRSLMGQAGRRSPAGVSKTQEEALLATEVSSW